MTDIIVQEYKGYTIKLRPDTEQFYAEGEYSAGWFDTLKAIKDKIDRLIKMEAKDKGKFPMPSYQLTDGIRLILGKITSMNHEDKSAWFSDDKGNRRKIATYTHVYAVNDNNAEIAGKLAYVNEQILDYQKKREALFKSLTEPIKIGE